MNGQALLTRAVLGFSQAEAIAMGLDCVDLVFLRWLATWAKRGKMEHFDVSPALGPTQTFYWVDYSHALSSLPILGIRSARGLAKRLKKLCQVGVLQAREVKDARGRGTRMYYAFGDGFDRLSYGSKRAYDHKNARSGARDDHKNVGSGGTGTGVPVIAVTTGTEVPADCIVSTDCSVKDSPSQARVQSSEDRSPDQRMESGETSAKQDERTAAEREEKALLARVEGNKKAAFAEVIQETRRTHGDRLALALVRRLAGIDLKTIGSPRAYCLGMLKRMLEGQAQERAQTQQAEAEARHQQEERARKEREREAEAKRRQGLKEQFLALKPEDQAAIVKLAVGELNPLLRKWADPDRPLEGFLGDHVLKRVEERERNVPAGAPA